jgi:hypothetical protein
VGADLDDELLLRYIVREEKEIRTMRAAGPITEYLGTKNPLMALIEALLNQKVLDYISICKEGLSLSVGKERGENKPSNPPPPRPPRGEGVRCHEDAHRPPPSLPWGGV